MTRITVLSDSKGYTVESKGHSGYSKEGSDIVCAALSSALEILMNMFDAFEVEFGFDCDENIPRVRIEISLQGANASKADEIGRILKGYCDFVSNMAEQYPKYTQITTEV